MMRMEKNSSIAAHQGRNAADAVWHLVIWIQTKLGGLLIIVAYW